MPKGKENQQISTQDDLDARIIKDIKEVIVNGLNEVKLNTF